MICSGWLRGKEKIVHDKNVLKVYNSFKMIVLYDEMKYNKINKLDLP